MKDAVVVPVGDSVSLHSGISRIKGCESVMVKGCDQARYLQLFSRNLFSRKPRQTKSIIEARVAIGPQSSR